MKKRILTILLGNLIGIASAQTINKAVMAIRRHSCFSQPNWKRAQH